MVEVNTLKSLKADYKAKTGAEYDANKKPSGTAAPAPAAAATPAPAAASGDLALWETVTAQGNKIRELKSKKASKDEIMKEVNSLKTLKADFKAKTGAEYDANKKPTGGAATPAAAPTAASGDLALWETVTAQGNKIRELKSAKAAKDAIMAEVNTLKSLKADFKTKTGSDYDANKKPVGGGAASPVPPNAGGDSRNDVSQ